MTGLFLSRAGFNRTTPHATAILLISANLPDSDVISALWGSVSYLHWHRNLTHSLLLAPLLAFLTVAAVRAFRGPIAWAPALCAAAAGIASHLLLDLTNIYGVRLLLPFSGEWFHWDLTPVIDFWLWGMFLVCLAGPFLSNLVNSEMGASPRAKYPGRGFAILALGFLAAYNLGRVVLHTRAIGLLESREYDRSAPLRTAAFPEGENPLRWKGLVETERAYDIFRLDLARAFDPAMGETAVKPDSSPAIAAADATPPFQVLREFAIYPLHRLIPAVGSDGDTRVELSDLRFPFASTAILDKNLSVRRAWFQFTGNTQ